MLRTLLALPLSLALLVPLVPPVQDSQGPEPITGVVHDGAGQPLSRVRYWISGFEQREDDRWRLTFFSGEARMQYTDDQGRFELPGRADLRYDIDFDLRGKAPTFLQQVEAGAQLTVVLEEGRDVGGRVVQIVGAQERPISGTRVELKRANDRGLWYQTSTSSDDQGRFTFPAGRVGKNWLISCAGASIPLEVEPNEDLDDLRIEIWITREVK